MAKLKELDLVFRGVKAIASLLPRCTRPAPRRVNENLKETKTMKFAILCLYNWIEC